MPIPRPLFHPPRWLTRLLARLFNYLGYRGLVLTMFGLLWVMIGLSAYTLAGSVPPDPNLIHTQLPLVVRFGVWGILGLYSFMMGVTRSRWRPTGFAALFVGPFERACSYTYGLFATVGLGHVGPEWRYLTGLILYLVVTVTVVLFAAWPEPPDEAVHPDEVNA